MADKIDRAEFVRRCERDIETCAAEAAHETIAGFLLNALVWLVKVPKLHALKEHPTGTAFEIDLVPLDELRASHMRELPTFEDVSRELRRAYNTKPSGSVYDTLKQQLNEAITQHHDLAEKRIREQLLDSSTRDDMVDAFSFALRGGRTLGQQRSAAHGKTAEMLVRAFEEVRKHRSEKVIFATHDGHYELRKVEASPMQGRKVDMVIEDEMQMWSGKERAPGYNQADHAARQRYNPGGHGHVLKAREPSGSGWREDSDAVYATIQQRKKLEREGERFIFHVFTCAEADEVFVVERTERDRMPMLGVFMTWDAWDAWLKAWGHFPTQKELEYLIDGHARGYLHAMHPNARQLSDRSAEAMRQTSGSAFRIQHDMLTEQMKKQMTEMLGIPMLASKDKVNK